MSDIRPETSLGVESMTSSSEMAKTPSPPHHTPTKMERRMSHFKEYKFFRSFSAKVENWPMRKAEQLWRRMRERKIAEIEASEACKWLRAAGFPQYAQMYEDMQFPIDVSGVQSDHPFLDADSLQSLYRRLAALNRCANMKLEHQHAPKHTHEESDEENQCALSENWQYERKSRRWSRVVVEINPQAQQRLQAIADRAIAEQNARAKAERLDTDLLTVPGQESGTGQEDQNSRFRRSGSERFRDGAKAFLRRVESMKSRRRRRHNRDGVVISSPQVLDVDTMNEKMKDLNCFDVSPSANIDFIDFPSSPIRSHPPSPLATMPSSPMNLLPPSFIGQVKLSPTPFGDDSSSYCSDGSQGSGHRSSTRSKLGSRAKKLLHKSIRAEDSGALSDSECQPSSWRHHYFKDANSNNTKVVLVEPPSPPEIPILRPRRTSPCPSPRPPQRSRSRSPVPYSTARTSSLNFGKEKFKDGALKREKSVSGSELSGSQESGCSHHDEAHDKVHADFTSTAKGGPVQRWHSFQRSSSLGSRPESAIVLAIPSFVHAGEDIGARPMAAMSCGQLQVLRKLALLKLTGYMEKYCPTHRTGWNWELPKFIRKIKAPDYKDKMVFGVPLLVSLQRTGHALPKPIRTALSWLRNNALDQIGIFRKAGVRSRTLRLRQLAESAGITGAGNTHNTSAPLPSPATLSPYDEQQAHDVADMVKQYFRELPDALLTNKLSETFIAIFQHVPQDFREEAVQYALLLLPEEHREALQVVLAFLQQVADHSATNQMTASNLAVCLAPTLLRLHHHQQGQGNSNKEGNSNRKRGGNGSNTRAAAPDPRELNESKAAHDCLLFLIKKHRELFTVSNETLQQCTFTNFEESIPVTLEDLGSEFPNNWKDYQQASTQALLKEAREKSRGWVSVSTHEPHVDLCYRKVGDGHPLRLWRVTTEVEAPPREVLHRILRERQIWDDSLLKCRIVQRLDAQAEVFQYVTASMAPLQAKDYCVLRSWQSDLPRGGCCVVETSVSHSDAAIMLGGVRAVVLASRYLIEPAGKGRSRLVHLARVDTKGRTPEWYNKSYGHLCSLYSARIRASFKHNTDGPESNV
ncbi:rhoGTPase activating protein isoform X3 [Arctopsyche grandis]|uniref:rhoGTPase activating protein isoform X3 n=1 Tax=Arctopsyche grandis TaxID=121162 RepID=UPI00406D787B